MYHTRSEAEVTLGRATEYESMHDEIQALFRQSPGYVGATLLQSYGNPGRYTLTGRWADRESARAAVRSESFAATARDLLNSGLARPTRLIEAYESVFEVDGANVDWNQAKCEILIDWTLKSPLVARAFEASRREVGEVTRQFSPGFVSFRLRRFLGNDTRYLAIAIVTDRAAARGRLATPEVQQAMRAHPYTEYADTPPVMETFDVVKRYAPLTAAATQVAVTAAHR